MEECGTMQTGRYQVLITFYLKNILKRRSYAAVEALFIIPNYRIKCNISCFLFLLFVRLIDIFECTSLEGRHLGRHSTQLPYK